jgi:hypothetical protein
MKILAFGDTHNSEKAKKEIKDKITKEDPDLVICIGDITVFESNIEKEMEFLGKLKKRVLLIHGNHESAEIMYMLSEFYKNIEFMHMRSIEIEGIKFIAYGGGGFAEKDKEFEDFTKSVESKDQMLVLITHGPPYGCKLDLVSGNHVGNKSYRKFIDKNNVVLAISGHIHENSGKTDTLKGKKLINPGPLGKIIKV